MNAIKNQLADVAGSRKERYSAKVRLAKAWLATDEGKAWLAANLPEVRRKTISDLGIQPADVDFASASNYVKSSRGTWGLQVGSRAAALSKAECEARGLKPGPGND